MTDFNKSTNSLEDTAKSFEQLGYSAEKLLQNPPFICKLTQKIISYSPSIETHCKLGRIKKKKRCENCTANKERI